MKIRLDPIEIAALKKLAIINHALGQGMSEPAKTEQLALTGMLSAIISRAEAAAAS